MNIQSHIMRFRANKRKKDRSNPLGTIGLVIAAVLSITAAAGVIIGVDRYSAVTKDLPTPEQMEILLNPTDGELLEPTRILDNQGQIELWRFENPAVDHRRYINITDGSMLFFRDAPEAFINAALAAIDPIYFQRPGNFISSIMDSNIDPIPQKLVSELLLWDEITHPYRDIRINLLADQIVGRYGRQKIFEWYLNSAYFGNQIYGASQAANYYFGSDLENLDLADSALLAAVIKYPSLNPFDAPAAAKENQEKLLTEMSDLNLISLGEAELSGQKQLIYADPENTSSLIRPPYIDYILNEASVSVPRERLLMGGFNLISTIDEKIQHELECTTEIMIERVYGGEPALNPDCEASRLLPKYNGKILDHSDSLEINVVLLDPVSGEVRGMAGISEPGNNLSLDEARNPGTLITPYLYLNAFTRGYEPASLVWDIPIEGKDFTPNQLHPGCTENCDFQGPVNIRTALGNDYLSPAVQLWSEQGIHQIRNTLTLFGFSLDEENCLDCPLFSESPVLEMIDLAQGFGVFVNQGYLRGKNNGSTGLDIQPASIIRIEDRSGLQWAYGNDVIEKKIINEELVYLINNVLSDEFNRADSKYSDVFQIGRITGVKVGFVPESESGWVIGYTPQFVTAVWAGDPTNAEQTTGADYIEITSSIWRAITQSITREQINEGWVIPPRTLTLDVCFPSGMLPTENCPRIVREVFIQGSEPQGTDTLYQALEVNRETGQLASVFTASQQIEERVYLNVPDEAKTWAEQVGLATPPTMYDLENSNNTRDGYSFTYPGNFSFINGQIRIVGSIPEEEFVSARIQYGVGMNPRSWLQIGPEITNPGENSRLGLWDTTDLDDGIYALQLVLIKERQQIEKISLVVSVDNTLPELIFKTDLIDGDVSFERGKEILFEVEFGNSSEIQQVDFVLNDELLSFRKLPPFIHPWIMAVGEYELVIRAEDQAGNQSEFSIEFNVIDD